MKLKRSDLQMVLFWLLLGAGGCSSQGTLKGENHEEGNFKQNEAIFQSYLENPHLQVAGRFAKYFETLSLDQSRTKGAELLTQYYMMNCRMRSAFNSAQSISSESRKKLFLAVIYTLSSVKRPDLFSPFFRKKSPKTQIEQNKLLEESATHKVFNLSEKPKFWENEIWRDEWVQLRFRSTCEEQKLVKDSLQRRKLIALAKRYFEAQSLEVFLSDFTLVSLALDVGVIFPHQTKGYAILEKFKNSQYSDDPYFHRLKKQIAQQMQIDTTTLTASLDEPLYFRFSALRLKSDIARTNPIKFPLLTRRESQDSDSKERLIQEVNSKQKQRP